MYNIIVPNLVHGWILCAELCGLSAEVIHNLPTPLSLPGHRLRDSSHSSAVDFLLIFFFFFESLFFSVCDG